MRRRRRGDDGGVIEAFLFVPRALSPSNSTRSPRAAGDERKSWAATTSVVAVDSNRGGDSRLPRGLTWRLLWQEPNVDRRRRQLDCHAKTSPDSTRLERPPSRVQVARAHDMHPDGVVAVFIRPSFQFDSCRRRRHQVVSCRRRYRCRRRCCCHDVGEHERTIVRDDLRFFSFFAQKRWSPPS